jgi:FkbM family methyltransferase
MCKCDAWAQVTRSGQAPALLGRMFAAVKPQLEADVLIDGTAIARGSVRVGRRLSSARWPSRLEGLRRALKKLAWTAVEARQVSTPVRYALRELTSHDRSDYSLRSSGTSFSVRHRSGDIDIFRKFYGYGYYELPAELLMRLRSVGRPIDILDLGANIGLFEVFASDRLSVGRAVCFEPDPANAGVLTRVRMANDANWEIVCACASNTHGRTRFTTGRKNFSKVDETGDLIVERIDVFPFIERADLVKMNIEGSEWDILRDSRLAQTSAAWIVEYHRIASPSTDIHSLSRALFERAGYTVRLAARAPDNGLLWAWKT